MKTTKIKSKIFHPLFLVTTALLIFTGCNYSDNPIAHENEYVSSENMVNSDHGQITLLKIDKSKLFSLQKDDIDSTTFYAEDFMEAKDGGKLEIKNDLNGDSKLEIEKDALPHDMTVAFKWCESNLFQGAVFNADSPDVEFTFNEPVKIKLGYAWADFLNVDENTLGLFLYNKTSDSWDQVEADIDLNHDEIEAYLPKSGTFRILQQIDGGLLEFHKRDPQVFYGSKFIKADKGGKVKVGNSASGKSKIEFKRGDLPEDMLIEFEWAADGGIDGRFAPHGTYFNNPVLVEFSYKLADIKGIDETKLFVVYFNENLGLWEYIGGEINTNDQIVSAYLEHFSRYAVAYGR